MSGRILILGGGFGGVRTALDLSRLLNNRSMKSRILDFVSRLGGTKSGEKVLGDKADITLIDKSPEHLFLPALYEVASAYGENVDDKFQVTLRRTVSIPYSEIFKDKKVTVVQSNISRIDVAQQTVSTESGTIFTYDYLVLALGSEIADYGIPGVTEYAYQFRSVNDALLINRKITQFYKGNICQTRPLHIGIGGAGFSGIELAAELAQCAAKTADRCGVKVKPVIFLFEAQPQLLPNVTDAERDIVCRRLNKLGVGIIENARIASVHADKVVLDSGRNVALDMMVWTAGIQANRLLRSIDDILLTAKGKIIVDEYLRALNFPNVYAVGDNIDLIDHKTQKPVPGLAYLAIDHGEVAAQNIVRSINGQELRRHKPFYETWIAPIGGKWALAHILPGVAIPGFMGWILREIVDLRYFLSILPPFKAISFLFNEIKVFVRND